MTTPTGYTFLYNGVEKDFVDVFDKSNPGTVITGYESEAYGLDLGKIFTPTTGGTLQTFYENSTNKDLGNIFTPIPLSPFSTNGTISNTNPFVTSAPTNGYKYILFNSTTTSYYFNVTNPISRLYYMIVGAGAIGGNGTGTAANSLGGIGGGAGGCWNSYIDNFSMSNYTITIPVVSASLYTELTNGSTFTLRAQNGSERTRGSIVLNSNVLSPSSNTNNEIGVGGVTQSGSYVVGGGVYTNTGNTGNYLTFLGDNLMSNTYFGGGGGVGATARVTNNLKCHGGDGGGGGGGATRSGGAISVYGNGGIGINGNRGGNASTLFNPGGAAFNSIGQGYGGGGGGGSGDMAGGNGGGAVLLLYFQSP